MTPSQAKNAIRRGLRDLCDRQPSAAEKDEIWRFFESACAYCGRPLIREERKGHIDHLVSSAVGGHNGLGNRVLSCDSCNGDKKREESWEAFIARECTDESTREVRRQRITQWIALAAEHPAAPQLVEREIARVIAEFDKACAAIRAERSR
jgi:hypothetical protein